MGRNWIFINYQFGTGSGSSNRLVRFRSAIAKPALDKCRKTLATSLSQDN